MQIAGESINDFPLNTHRRRRFLAKCAGINLEDKEARERAENEHRFGETVTGKQTRSARPHRALKAAEGLQGLSGAPYLAARYSFLMDESARTGLYWELLKKASEIAARNQLGVHLARENGQRHAWCEPLCELVLTDDWLHSLFVRTERDHAVNLYAVAMGVSPEVWETKLRKYFDALKVPYEGWLRRARRHVENAIFDEFHRVASRPAA